VSRAAGAGGRPRAAPVAWRRLDGVLLADKPRGASSNGFLQTLRRLYRADKGGHGGTLDPMATGLMVVCFGEATKFSSWLLESTKRYEGEIALGARTDSGDAEGRVIAVADVPERLADLATLAAAFTGPREQRPPMYSALKHEGRPLYEYARQGIEVEKPARRIVIQRLTLERITPATLRFDVVCSTGTYVRVLAEELAAALGTLGHLSALRRTASGPFGIDEAVTLEALEALDESGRLARLLGADRLPYALDALELDETDATYLMQGRQVRLATPPAPARYRAYAPGGRFLGVVETDDDGVLRAQRLMATGSSGAGAEEVLITR
jgi:tRNA pseudouridine55 synthase